METNCSLQRAILFSKVLPAPNGALDPRHERPIFPGCLTVFADETLPRGSEFLDAEAEGQNRPEKEQVLPTTQSSN
jgi:hypothetical protein